MIEYKVVLIPPANFAAMESQELEDILNSYGHENWRLCTMTAKHLVFIRESFELVSTSIKVDGFTLKKLDVCEQMDCINP